MVALPESTIQTWHASQPDSYSNNLLIRTAAGKRRRFVEEGVKVGLRALVGDEDWEKDLAKLFRKQAILLLLDEDWKKDLARLIRRQAILYLVEDWRKDLAKLFRKQAIPLFLDEGGEKNLARPFRNQADYLAPVE